MTGVQTCALPICADVFQLRDKDASDDELLAAAESARERCHAAGALFVLNDRPDLAAACGADGVHVGQDDMPVDRAREDVGDDAIVGLSTHSIQQAQAGCRGGGQQLVVGRVLVTQLEEVDAPGQRALERAVHPHPVGNEVQTGIAQALTAVQGGQSGKRSKGAPFAWRALPSVVNGSPFVWAERAAPRPPTVRS